MLRGCEYQVWQTVSAWCDLGPADVLFVEGAEDFDVIGPADAEAYRSRPVQTRSHLEGKTLKMPLMTSGNYADIDRAVACDFGS